MDKLDEKDRALLLLAKCTMPQESNVCGDYNIKWLFDPAAGSCMRSWDSGCDVDAHRFDGEEDCKSVCVNPSGYGKILPQSPIRTADSNVTQLSS